MPCAFPSTDAPVVRLSTSLSILPFVHPRLPHSNASCVPDRLWLTHSRPSSVVVTFLIRLGDNVPFAILPRPWFCQLCNLHWTGIHKPEQELTQCWSGLVSTPLVLADLVSTIHKVCDALSSPLHYLCPKSVCRQRWTATSDCRRNIAARAVAE